MPPNELKRALSQAGIDLEKIAASVGDAAVFVEGNSQSTLGGALVVDREGRDRSRRTRSPTSACCCAAPGMPGVTAVSGKASGFSVRSAGLGAKPLVVAAKGEPDRDRLRPAGDARRASN